MSESLARLMGLGPKSSQMLARAGIHTEQDLRALGAVAAYVKTKRANAGVSLNLLWALEGALTATPWQQVARTERTRLLLELDAAEQSGLFGALSGSVTDEGDIVSPSDG